MTYSRIMNNATKTRPARLDADRTARPMTVIVGHAREGAAIRGFRSLDRIEVRDAVCTRHDDCNTCLALARECQIS